jgi:hypothetical protein
VPGVSGADIASLPGYRRRFRIIPAADRVTTAMEDDYHCMVVTLHHDGTKVTQVDADLRRAPWTTCPGAPARLVETFAGVALADVAARGEKQTNCTHLHDLAVLAAAHAGDSAPSQIDIYVSDRDADGRNVAELHRNGGLAMRWEIDGFELVDPAEIAGMPLMKLRPWIESLGPVDKEAAKLLQWGAIVAHGRAKPIADQSDASKMPPNCYTFQPDNAGKAVRVGQIIDFSTGETEPLAGM